MFRWWCCGAAAVVPDLPAACRAACAAVTCHRCGAPGGVPRCCRAARAYLQFTLYCCCSYSSTFPGAGCRAAAAACRRRLPAHLPDHLLLLLQTWCAPVAAAAAISAAVPPGGGVVRVDAAAPAACRCCCLPLCCCRVLRPCRSAAPRCTRSLVFLLPPPAALRCRLLPPAATLPPAPLLLQMRPGRSCRAGAAPRCRSLLLLFAVRCRAPCCSSPAAAARRCRRPLLVLLMVRVHWSRVRCSRCFAGVPPPPS